MANLLWNATRNDATVASDGTKNFTVVTANSNYKTYFAEVQPNTTYTIKFAKSIAPCIGLCSKYKNPYCASNTISACFNSVITSLFTTTKTFTTGANDTFAVIYTSAADNSAYAYNAQMNAGSTAETYSAPTIAPHMFYEIIEWNTKSDINNGYPYTNADMCQYGIEPSNMSVFKDSIWCMHPTTNDGYPFILAITDIVNYPQAPKQYNYVSVYASNETDFTHNGLRILCPTDIKIDEELNGGYELSLTHPQDEDGNWQFLLENNIIKSADGQLYRIYKRDRKMDNSGTVEIQVNAIHVFYDLNGYYIENAQITALSGNEVLTGILGGSENGTPPFTATSNMTSITYANTFKDVSATYAIMGDANSFISKLGGVLKRDNFAFSINSLSSDIAFEVNYGCDMTEVDESVDFSNVYNSAHIYFNVKSTVEGVADAVYERIATYDTSSGISMPFDSRTFATIDLEIDTAQPDPEVLTSMAKYWLASNTYPIVNYSVGIIPLKNIPEYSEFVNLQNFDVGAIGVIRNSSIGISTIQQIVKKTIDGITGEAISIELGSLKPSFTANKRFDIPSYQASQIENTIAVTTPTA